MSAYTYDCPGCGQFDSRVHGLSNCPQCGVAVQRVYVPLPILSMGPSSYSEAARAPRPGNGAWRARSAPTQQAPRLEYVFVNYTVRRQWRAYVLGADLAWYLPRPVCDMQPGGWLDLRTMERRAV